MRIISAFFGAFLAIYLVAAEARAAEVQNFTLRVQGEFSLLDYAQLGAMDMSNGAFQSRRNVRFSAADAASLSGHRLEETFFQTFGSVQFSYDADADPSRGNAVTNACSGILTFLCQGSVQVFDMAAQALSSFTTNSMQTTLTADGLLHENDHDVRWTAGSTYFFNSGGMEQVQFAITGFELELSPVPISNSFILLCAALLGMSGIAANQRKRSRA